MAEETTLIQTQTTEPQPEATPTAETKVDSSETEPKTIESATVVDDGKKTVEADSGFTISDIEFPDDLSLDESEKQELFDKNKDLFKGKNEVNAYLKQLAEIAKNNKESQKQKVAELEQKWESELKTDPVYGKNYSENEKKVSDVIKKFANEKDVAELEKFGFTKSPALKRMIAKIADEFEGAKIVAATNPPKSSTPKTDSYGRTVFDFSKPIKEDN